MPMQFLSLPTAPTAAASPAPHLLPPKPFFLKPLSSSAAASFRRLSQSPPPPPNPPPPPPPPPPTPPPLPNPLSSKLWLSSKLSPPPPPPPPPRTRKHHPPPPPPPVEPEPEPEPEEEEDADADADEGFRQKGKVFVGNLPPRARKAEVADFFRQFGPLDKVELVRAHDDPERNDGFCFLYYADTEGQGAKAATERAAEVDGVDFRGRSLTVRLDDGRKGRARAEDRARWVDHGQGKEAPSPWHHGRDEACREFRRVMESRPEDWQAVVSAFERVPKVGSSPYHLGLVFCYS